MKSITIVCLAFLLVSPVDAKVIYQNEGRSQVQGEKVYQVIKDKIEIPDDVYESLPKYEMGKQKIPVSVSDVIKLSDEYFQKSLKLPFTADSGFLSIELSWSGSLGESFWWYHVKFSPFNQDTDYHLAIPMNGKVYPAKTTKKEYTDSSNPIKESKIPFLNGEKRNEVYLIEKEFERLTNLPSLKSNKIAGVYLNENRESAYVFYEDGRLFTIHAISHDFYKVDKDGRVFTTYVYGPKKDKIGSDQYIGVIKDGKFFRDMDDTGEFYYLKQQGIEPSGKP